MLFYGGMENPRPYQQFDFETRQRAVRLVTAEGWSTADVAQAIGCSLRTVQHWVRKSAAGEQLELLRTPPFPGAPPKLTAPQRSQLVAFLSAGPQACGFPSQLWTGKQVAALIHQRFQVTYHDEYIPRLLKALGFSRQRPHRQAHERNETTITSWRDSEWPAIEKKHMILAQP
ncbi:MAG: winged helix-turn-helix domain-containing protein [Gemmataceae bacterium]